MGAALDARPGDAPVVVFSTAAAEEVRRAVPFHQIVRQAPPRAAEVIVTPPDYRGKRFLDLVSWLVTTNVAAPSAHVTWRFPTRVAKSSAAVLERLGWNLESDRGRRVTELAGHPPASADAPAPQAFTANVRGRAIEFAADYGVFSPDHIDAGSQLLLEAALEGPRVDVVADVGVGYGALSVSLLVHDVAGRAVATEIDSVALWLAEANADNAGVELDVVFDPDPSVLEPTELTVCNVPTHLPRRESDALMAGLTRRATPGRVLAVVHRSLVERYAQHFVGHDLAVREHAGLHHVVLEAHP